MTDYNDEILKSFIKDTNTLFNSGRRPYKRLVLLPNQARLAESIGMQEGLDFDKAILFGNQVKPARPVSQHTPKKGRTKKRSKRK